MTGSLPGGPRSVSVWREESGSTSPRLVAADPTCGSDGEFLGATNIAASFVESRLRLEPKEDK